MANDRVNDVLDAAGIPSSPPSGVLFHYTSAEGLRKILQDGEIFASHVNFLNDASEFDYGAQILFHRLGALHDAGLDHWIPRIERGLRDRASGEIFATCFCEDDDLLSQWYGYGAAGAGYAIGFRTETMARQTGGALVPVSYGEDEVASRIDRALDWAIGRMRQKRVVKPEYERQVFDALLLGLYFMISASKHHVFAHEREWRLLSTESVRSEFADVDFRDVGGLLIPYVRITIPRIESNGQLDIHSIRCGPTLHDAATEVAIRMLLAKCGIEGAAVTRSVAPLRR